MFSTLKRVTALAAAILICMTILPFAAFSLTATYNGDTTVYGKYNCPIEIADSVTLTAGGYGHLTHEDVLKIFEACR